MVNLTLNIQASLTHFKVDSAVMVCSVLFVSEHLFASIYHNNAIYLVEIYFIYTFLLWWKVMYHKQVYLNSDTCFIITLPAKFVVNRQMHKKLGHFSLAVYGLDSTKSGFRV